MSVLSIALRGISRYIGLPAAVLWCSAPLSAAVTYVDADATGTGTGTSWADAYDDLQDALAVVANGSQVWIAEGTYKPSSTGDRNASFVVPSGVELYGGFVGTETQLDQRDPETYETILSGDIGIIDDKTDNSLHVVTTSGTNTNTLLDGLIIRDGYGDGAFPNSHGAGVFNQAGSPTVRNCSFIGNDGESGGGIYNGSGGNPHIVDCFFLLNTSTTRGGAIYNSSSTAAIENCVFSENSAAFSGGAVADFFATSTMTGCRFLDNAAQFNGGAVYGTASSNQTLTDCEFTGNFVYSNFSNSSDGGGGYYNNSGNAIVRDCVFEDNLANRRGGGIYTTGGTLELSRTFFLDNYAADDGGGLYHISTATDMVSCRFIRNSANTGGGIYNSGADPALSNIEFIGNQAFDRGAGFRSDSGNPVLTHVTLASNVATNQGGGLYLNGGTTTLANAILWANDDSGGTGEPAQIRIAGGTVVIDYSCVKGWTGGFGGSNNTGSNPQFRDLNGADNIPGNEDDDLRLTVISPYVDAGDNSVVPADSLDIDNDGNIAEPLPLDVRERERFWDIAAAPDTGNPTGGPPGAGIVDIGAHELRPPVPADFDGDDDVDDDDCNHLVTCTSGPAIPQTLPNCQDADLDSDGDVDQVDFGIHQICISGADNLADPFCAD